MLDSIDFRISNYKKQIDLSLLSLSHDYNLIKKENYKDGIEENNTILNVEELIINNSVVKSKSFSKRSNKLITKEE